MGFQANTITSTFKCHLVVVWGYCSPQSPCSPWCLASCVAWVKYVPQRSQMNDFSPVCARIWLFKVVAPANKRAQKPHLKGFSWRWISTWAHKSWVVENDKGQCAHWKGFSEWRVHTWIWSKILWVKVLWHCLHFHTLISLSFVSLMSTFIVWSSAILSSFQPVLLKLLFSSNTCEFCWRTWPGWVASPSGSLRFWLEEYPLEMLK